MSQGSLKDLILCHPDRCTLERGVEEEELLNLLFLLPLSCIPFHSALSSQKKKRRRKRRRRRRRRMLANGEQAREGPPPSLVWTLDLFGLSILPLPLLLLCGCVECAQKGLFGRGCNTQRSRSPERERERERGKKSTVVCVIYYLCSTSTSA